MDRKYIKGWNYYKRFKRLNLKDKEKARSKFKHLRNIAVLS